jgi:hypothetical protein
MAPCYSRWYPGVPLPLIFEIIPPQRPLEDIQIISSVLAVSGIREGFGKISTEMMRATHHPYKIFDLINYYSHNCNFV